ncbi:hypothetical protein ABZ949_31950 [Micromonospora tulbaghiae]|uniref:hypothetical protein n=1 Tax=Micromonospora tulbaghiae TaxID=479978 RepID=UPI0033D6F3A9
MRGCCSDWTSLATPAARSCARPQGAPASACDDPLREWLGGVLRRHSRTFSAEVMVGHWTMDPVMSSLSLGTASPRIGMRYVQYKGPSAFQRGWPNSIRRCPRMRYDGNFTPADMGRGQRTCRPVVGRHRRPGRRGGGDGWFLAGQRAYRDA